MSYAEAIQARWYFNQAFYCGSLLYWTDAAQLMSACKNRTPHDSMLGILSHWGLATSKVLVNISSDNGLVPEGTKPLSESMSIHSQFDS